MAYPIISGPYGLKPVNLMGGRQNSGSTRMIPIQQGYATNIYNGDVVGLSVGTAVITPYSASGASAATAGAIVGVFLGCEYSVPGAVITGKNRFQYYAQPQTTSSDIVGYVLDDPQALFKVAVVSQSQGSANTQANTGTNIGYMSPRFVGTNAFLVAGNGGSTATGDSFAGISGANPTVASSVAGNIIQTVATGAATSPCLRVVQLVPDTAVTVATTITSATGSGTSFVVASSTGLQPGMQVVLSTATGTSAGAPGNTTYVTGVVTSTNTVTVSASVSWTQNQSVAFVGYPEVIVGWNFGFHTYNIAAGV
jgi:hypothetical protein